MENIQSRLLSINQTAKYLGISARTIYNQTHRKAVTKFPIKFLRIGKLIKFDVNDLEAFIQSSKH